MERPQDRSTTRLSTFTTERVAIDAALAKLQSRGGTPLYEAANDAMTLLQSASRKGAILLLTDGQARGGHERTVARAKELGIPLYVVGLGNNLDFGALRSLSIETGGFFVEAGQSDALARAFRGAGTGIAVGKVRIFGRGSTASLEAGPHVVSGDVVIRDPQSSREVWSPFQFSAEMSR